MLPQKRTALSIEDNVQTDSNQVENDKNKKAKTKQLLLALNKIWFNGSEAGYKLFAEEYKYYTSNSVLNKKKRQPKTKYKRLKKSIQELIPIENNIPISPAQSRLTIEHKPAFSIFNRILSSLQHQYLLSGPTIHLTRLPLHIETYNNFLKECQESDDDEEEEEEGEFKGETIIGSSCWTPSEKKRFFTALERCSKGDIAEISRRVGPTKTVVEVANYIKVLEAASRVVKKEPMDDEYSAREMSPLFIVQENRFAELLQRMIETKVYAKHQEVLNSQPECLQRALDLFDILNFSSMSSIFSNTNDMTILSSSIVQYYQLVKHFVIDIIASLYTELIHESDKVVTRSLMNHVIAKRERLWKSLLTHSRDSRLKNLDIMSMLYGVHRSAFSNNKSSSFLAKRRRQLSPSEMDEEEDDEENEEKSDDTNEASNSTHEMVNEPINDKMMETGVLKQNNDTVLNPDTQEYINGESDSFTEEENLEDEMLQPVDDQDKLQSYYIRENDRYIRMPAFSDIKEEESNTYYEDDDDTDEQEDEETEERMRQLDQQYEADLIRRLLFFNENSLLMNHS
ncbi:hypothetical protein RMATCC62417_15949 [Rhizopus microsporus]|nr:hypothetical protein RMATCC62417_15949 [Rhizopus microsporus]